MRIARTIAVGLGLSLFLCAPGAESVAQPPLGAPGGAGGGGGGMGGMMAAPGGFNPIQILMAPAVQEELKLTESQKTELYQLQRDAGMKGRDLFQAMLQSGGGGNPQGLMMAGMQMRQENEKLAAKILKPEQKERANQIILRVEGAMAVARPEVASKLNLTADQKDVVQSTMIEMMMAQRQMFMASRMNNANNPTGMPDLNQSARARSNMTSLRESASKQISRALNGKQKAAFNKLLGEPFDVSRIDPDLPKLAAASATPSSAPEDAPAPEPEKPRKGRKRATSAKKPVPKDTPDEAKPKN